MQSYKLQCNTPLLDSFRQLSSVNQTCSTAIGTHGSARHFDLTFIDSQAMVAVDVCIDGRPGDDAEWRDNMQQYLWRALAKSDAHTKMLSYTRNGNFFKLSRSQRI